MFSRLEIEKLFRARFVSKSRIAFCHVRKHDVDGKWTVLLALFFRFLNRRQTFSSDQNLCQLLQDN